MNTKILNPNLDVVISNSGKVNIVTKIGGKQVVVNNRKLQNKLLYTASKKPESWWIDANCYANVYDQNTGEGYLLLNADVTELVGIDDSEHDLYKNIFSNHNMWEDEPDIYLYRVVVPKQITTISTNAISFERIDGSCEIILPETITEISKYGIAGDDSEEDGIMLTVNATTPPNVCAEGLYDINTCYVQKESYEDYINDECWTEQCGMIIYIGAMCITYISNGDEPHSDWITNNCKSSIFRQYGQSLLILNDDVIEINNDIQQTNIFNDINGDITNVFIPEGILTLKSAFYGMTNLYAAFLPESLITIDADTFANCTELYDIKIPSKVTEIGDCAFKDTQISSMEYEAINCNVGSDNNLSSLVNLHISKNVQTIPGGLFNGSQIKNIEIPESVTIINESAFKDCTELTTVCSMSIIPPILGEHAFTNIGTTTCIVPTDDAVTNYQNSAWADYFTEFVSAFSYFKLEYISRTKLDTDWIIDNCLENEWDSATEIGYLILKPDVTFISGFSYNHSLKRINKFPESIHEIGRYAFNDCDNLEYVNLYGIEMIHQYAFNGCSNLLNIDIPETLRRIDKRAFYYNRFSSITIPYTVEGITLAEDSFAYGYNLTTVYINGPCYTDGSLSPFRHCSLFTKVIFAEGIQTVNRSMFNQCEALEEVILPSTITQILMNAFSSCQNLISVTCYATNPPDNVVGFSNTQATLYVPAESVSVYQNDINWSNYFQTITAIQE